MESPNPSAPPFPVANPTRAGSLRARVVDTLRIAPPACAAREFAQGAALEFAQGAALEFAQGAALEFAQGKGGERIVPAHSGISWIVYEVS